LENVTFAIGNLYDLNVDEGVQIIGRNVTFASNPVYNNAKRFNPGMYIADYGGALGYWKAQNSQGIMQTSVAARSGGEAFSVYMENTGSASLYDGGLQLGLPCLETMWVSLSAGTRTIAVYGAYKLFGSDPPTTADLWMEFDYIASGSGAVRTIASTKTAPTVSTGNSLTSDASSWTGDTGLTGFVLTSTVSVGQSCFVPIRIYNQKFTPGGYVYIDPKVVVT
jgi:hypothetical protein